ncbi:unnamed protein product [Phytophthora fragariaefolia]|uniref:Unnamed protein product n=1 Tax=Phytophthora fragariaefolia TaxID=1490495 RepID=A0A9W6YGR4_9STRA|nr:unnamed protein product [Phytophthora fragariaefolia]
MKATIRKWVQSCRDCGARKTKAREVIAPLQSQGVGDTGDWWALDIAGPLPVTEIGYRYVVAAVDYATRFAVVAAVPSHAAKDIARFIVEKLVLVYGPMREVVMDGTPELNSAVIEALVDLLQTKIWNDIFAIFVAETQDDWDHWLACAAYAHNGARHSGMRYSPNELMLGRRRRAPNELLRMNGVTQVGVHADYHRKLVTKMAKATEAARVALERDQQRRARYYNRQVRQTKEFSPGDLVWVLRRPRGRAIPKLAHQWVGPAKIVQDAGYDNWEVVRDDNGERLITHSSFLVNSRCPSDSLGLVAERVLMQLAEEEGDDSDMPRDSVVNDEIDVMRNELATSRMRRRRCMWRSRLGQRSDTAAVPNPEIAATSGEVGGVARTKVTTGSCTVVSKQRRKHQART